MLKSLKPRSLYSIIHSVIVASATLPSMSVMAENFTLEEVIVTSQRRAENVQDVPISILAYDVEAIETARLTDVDEVVAYSPNIVLNNSSPSNKSIYIRGIGTNLSQAGAENSVGLAVDDIFLTRKGAAVMEMFDVERMEVLRGPQGTLYGKNVVGGAINIINKAPVMEREAKIEVGIGDYNLIETKGMFNLPLGENTSMRAVLNYRERDGYIENSWQPVDAALYNPDPFNNFQQCSNCSGDMDAPKNVSGRVSFKGGASEKFSWQASISHAKTDVDGVHTRVDNIISGTLATAIDLTGITTDWFDVENGNTPGYLDQDFTLASLKLEYETAVGVLTSITGGQWLNYDSSIDVVNAASQYPSVVFGGSPGGAGFRSQVVEDESSKAFSQEFRFASLPGGPMTLDDRLEWIAGLYYSVEDLDREFSRIRRITFNPVFALSTSAALFTQKTTRTTYAAFGQLTYSLTDRLDITVGGRYTVDDLDFSAQVTNPLGGEPYITDLNPALELFDPTDSNESWEEPTGQISLQYRPTDDIMLYTTYSRGFKGGGFQGDAGAASVAEVPFSPEFADNYEVGIKTQLFNRSLQFNLTYFKVDFDDLQLTQRIQTDPNNPATATQVVINAAKAEITGTEFEIIWMPPVEGLVFNLSGGTLDSEVTDSVDPLIAGFDLAQTPEFSGTAAVSYSYQMANLSSLDFRLAYRYTGEFWWDLGNKEPGLEEDYGLLDANVTLLKDNWRVSLWGKNLTEEEYYSSGFSTDQIPGTNRGGASLNRIGDPRTFGVTVSYEFD